MTIFSKIIAWEIPATKLYEDDLVIVIKDINPKAKTHLLVIPKKEIPTINDITEIDKDLLWHMFIVAKKMAFELGINEGYQLHFNVWEKWWQEVMHIHMHILSDLK